MEQLKLSGYFYPTTVVFLIDNDIDFLNQLSLELDTQLAYRLFANTQLAWRFIYTKHTTNQLTHHNLRLNVAQSIQRISHSLNYWERFNEISVIVLDVSNITFNHLIFIENIIKHLKHPQPKIIAICDDNAPDALPANLLHEKVQRIFLKQDKNLVANIHRATYELQQEYFTEISAPVLKNHPYFEDSIFIKAFHQVCTLAKISEYYFCEKEGGFLLINETGQLSFLMIRTETAKGQYLNKLKWKNKFYTAKAIQGQQTYWWCVIKTNNALDWSINKKVFSYKKYMRSIWPPNC